MSTYAGESIAKKVCRVRLYRRAAEALAGWGPAAAGAAAVILPGPEASEVGALKYLLGLRPERVVAIDRDEASCMAAKRRWPGVRTITGDLGDQSTMLAAERLLPDGRATFVHLDLMGNLSEAAILAYGRWTQLLRVRGVVAVTYLRGRENRTSLGATRRIEMREFGEELQAFARRGDPTCRNVLRILSADFDRAASHMGALTEGLIAAFVARGMPLPNLSHDYWENGRRLAKMMPLGWTALASHSYRAETSPMGVLLAQLTDHGSESYWGFCTRRGRDVTSIIRKDPMDDLLAEADSLEKKFTKREVAEILNVSTSTLAAWRAHRTMGTYA